MTQKEIASQLYGISDKNLYNKIKLNSVKLFPVFEWAVHNKLDFNWLITGEGPKYIKPSGESGKQTSKNQQPYNVVPIHAGQRLADIFLDRSGIQLDDEGRQKLANFFRKRYENRLKGIEEEILTEVDPDIVDLLKGG